MQSFDLVVIGGGTAGLVSAAAAAELGARVALVERDRLGGECLNTGCVPSKALLASARRASDVRHAAAYGVHTGPVEVEFGAVMERMRRLRAELAVHDAAARFRGMGIELVRGAARFVAPDAIEVNGVRVPFLRAIVATGSRPQVPPIPGLEDTGYRTTDTLWDITQLPARLAILGGGPIGCELAQGFARLGARVTVIESAAHVLVHDDEDASKLLEKTLECEGVRILRHATVRQVSRSGEGVSLEVVASGTHERVSADLLLVATGRAARIDGLELEAAGVRADAERGIHVDDHLRTSNHRIFAAGDVCSPRHFTHLADAHARIAVQNALFVPWARASNRVQSWCTYTDPEIAHAGLTVVEIERDGTGYETLRREMTSVDRAVLDGHRAGFLKVHVRRGTDRILGATLVGRHAGDMIGQIALALETGATLADLSRTIQPYPTEAALIRAVADDARRRRLTPFLRRMLAWWFGHPSLAPWPRREILG